MSEPWWERAENALRYYLGPAYQPVEMAGNALAALSPGADMIDMQQESNALMQSHGGWDTVNAGLGLGAATLGMAIPGTAKGISEGVEGATDGIRAYHGSPHDFDAFSMDKIGTGEGAQAYGHGLYFAEGEGVARSYRDNIAGAARVEIDGKPVWHKGQTALGLNLPRDQDIATDALTRFPTPSEAVSFLKGRSGQYEKPGYHEARNAAIEMIESGRAVAPPSGHMYEVNINASPDDFLDWDKPLSEQPAKARGPLGLPEKMATDEQIAEARDAGRHAEAEWMQQSMDAAKSKYDRLMWSSLSRQASPASATWTKALAAQARAHRTTSSLTRS